MGVGLAPTAIGLRLRPRPLTALAEALLTQGFFG